jgi:bis(5'-nucleosyl)-tetraphosphatase (symmetrical)
MSTYVIGDIQGCYDELRKLVEKLEFDPRVDKLILTGDLVNRGPKSLETLRYIKSLGSSAQTVLGNHDLYLLRLAYKNLNVQGKNSVESILKAKDKIDLIEWLRHQPMLIEIDKYIIVHAGIPPTWTIQKTRKKASELEYILQSEICLHIFLENMLGDQPNKWSKYLEGPDRWRCIANYLTRMRFCLKSGAMELTHKGDLDSATERLIPWFSHPKCLIPEDITVLFGHWAALNGISQVKNIIALDTGCVWGNKLTAFCLETGRYTTVKSPF